MSEKQTPARELYGMFCRHAQAGRKGWSWVEFNGFANRFVLDLIRAGVAFTEADARWFSGYHHGAWKPLDGFAEDAYSAACSGRVPNDLARKAFEAAMGRKPYVTWTDGGSPDKYMACNSMFPWGKMDDGQTRWATINSFNDAEGRVNVKLTCHEQDPDRPKGWTRTVDLGLARITHEEFCAAFPKPKRPKPLKCKCGHGKRDHLYGRCGHMNDDYTYCQCDEFEPIGQKVAEPSDIGDCPVCHTQDGAHHSAECVDRRRR